MVISFLGFCVFGIGAFAISPVLGGLLCLVGGAALFHILKPHLLPGWRCTKCQHYLPYNHAE